jgi:hypothetical protein
MSKFRPLEITNEELLTLVALWEKHGKKEALAAAEIDMPRTNFRRRLGIAAERGLLGFNPILPGFAIKKVTTETDETGETTKQHIQQTKEAGGIFTLPDGHVIKGISSLTDADGRVLMQWIKTRLNDATPELVAALTKKFEEYKGKSEFIPAPPVIDTDLMSVYPIADQHNGMLSWGDETGEDYDLEIGKKRLLTCMKRLVGQSPRSAEAIILNLGDWQHTDDQKNMTPGHGNILDVDTRYFKLLSAGVDLMMEVIELALQKHGKVWVRNIPGNHDPHASIALTIALNAFYCNNPRVTVDLSPSDFFYRRFGATLIGATHGHKLKPEKMAMDMAVTRRKDWGETKYHWFLFGHIHHETVRECGDVRVESFQTLAGKDAYAASHGYTAGQSISSITLHREDGEIGRHRVNVFPVRQGNRQ